MVKKLMTGVVDKVKRDNERGARQALIEELFYDFHRSRKQVYVMNFVRGVFFGLGSVLGGTVLIALVVWIMSLFVDLPGIGQLIENLQQTLQESQQKR